MAIVAVDPTSPFTGGAILGDRIRMSELSGDDDVFIRSMANRGALGGVARATSSVVDALDAAGFDPILIETVGTGQAEVDVASAAHTVIVVDAPGMGDAIQALKAGVIEIAHILVVNKGDLPGAERTSRALRAALELGLAVRGEQPWDPPVLITNSLEGEGVPELADAIRDHREHLRGSGGWEESENQRVRRELESILRDQLTEQFMAAQPEGAFAEVVKRVLNRELSPDAAVEQLLNGDRR